MYEEDLKRIVCLHPELIESGLTIEQEEYPVRTGQTVYRCDLRGKDRIGRTTFIELKMHAGHSVVYQIAKYKAFLKEGRFIVAALSIDPEVKIVLKDLGFESVEIDKKRVEELLGVEKENPKLYVRESGLVRKPSMPGVSSHQFSDSEREIVSDFMNSLWTTMHESSGLPGGLRMVGSGVDVRSQDKYRILLQPAKYPSDKFVIYVRARKMDEIHLMYVPDFSFSAGSKSKKKAFKKFIDEHKGQLEDAFGLPLFVRGGGRHMGDWLEVTAQGWKGLSRVISRPVESWRRPDFVDVVASAMFDFIENVLPLVEEFYKETREAS